MADFLWKQFLVSVFFYGKIHNIYRSVLSCSSCVNDNTLDLSKVCFLFPCYFGAVIMIKWVFIISIASFYSTLTQDFLSFDQYFSCVPHIFIKTGAYLRICLHRYTEETKPWRFQIHPIGQEDKI